MSDRRGDLHPTVTVTVIGWGPAGLMQIHQLEGLAEGRHFDIFESVWSRSN